MYKTSIRMDNFVTLVLEDLIFDGFISKRGYFLDITFPNFNSGSSFWYQNVAHAKSFPMIY